MPKAEVQIYPPLSYHFQTGKPGPYTVKTKFNSGDSIADIITSLYKETPELWDKIFDHNRKMMRHPIKTEYMGEVIGPYALDRTEVSDGEKIIFKVLLGGG